MSDNGNNLPGTNIPDNDELSLGSIASVGFTNPGSPGDLTGSPPMPELGDVGAMDPAGDVDMEGADQRNTGIESRASSDLTDSDAATSSDSMGGTSI